MKVLLLEGIHDAAKEKFLQNDYEVESLSNSLKGDELKAKLKDVAVLGVRSGTAITKDILDSAPELIAIGVFSAGMDHVDIEAAKSSGVKVFNAGSSNARSVVELAVGAMITLARNIVGLNSQMQSGVWKKSPEGSYEVNGKTLGIIGYGQIGSQLSVVAEALGMKVVFYDISNVDPVGDARKAKSMEEVLVEADFISVHIDSQNVKQPIIGGPELELMKPSAMLINLSRGIVVNEVALAGALKAGQIAGAFIDVYTNEPKAAVGNFATPLQGLPNVVLTPHVGGSTEESQQRAGEYVADSIVEFVGSYIKKQ